MSIEDVIGDHLWNGCTNPACDPGKTVDDIPERFVAHVAAAVREHIQLDRRFDRLCEAMVESTTEYDWEPGHAHSLPEHLRESLRAWAADFHAWDRNNRGDDA